MHGQLLLLRRWLRHIAHFRECGMFYTQNHFHSLAARVLLLAADSIECIPSDMAGTGNGDRSGDVSLRYNLEL